MVLEEKVLDYIRSRQKGALQSDIWKKFGIDSRKILLRDAGGVTLEENVWGFIHLHPEGALQSDIWKKFGIDSRKCSRIITNLEQKGLVYKKSEVANGRRTYRVWPSYELLSRIITNLEQKGLVYKKSEVANGRRTYRILSRYDLLMANDVIAPCCGCTEECIPEYCVPLSRWLLKL